MISSQFAWRKTSDINRTHPLFELLRDGHPVLDVGLSEEGSIEISINPAPEVSPIDLTIFLGLIEDGVALVKRDEG